MIDAYSYNYDLATQEMARLTSGIHSFIKLIFSSNSFTGLHEIRWFIELCLDKYEVQA